MIKKSLFFPIPEVPPAKNLGHEMRYFIPEWDDHVDPSYDFIKDEITPKRDPYHDEHYAHQIYPSPNYDGILVSKTVLDKSKKKILQIEQVGSIHKFLRYAGSIMGDCGAFSYIDEELPPYSIDEILNYYHRFGFNFGVSIDHLIVGDYAAPTIREKRYQITRQNAYDFFEQYHREKDKRNYRFLPIGVAQGWSPETYANAVKELIDIGYDYVALGGLARATTQTIIDTLTAIRPHIQSNTRLHLFGVGRISAIPAFRYLGVTSFDSASALRRAWLDSKENYHALDGKTYAAVRVPQVNRKGPRIKHLVESESITLDELKQLEKNSLEALRKYDRDELSSQETLEILLAYDKFLELPKDGKVDPSKQAKRLHQHSELYKKLLEDKPWRTCDCVVCQALSVEVVIFRGNDRNRRRGFHNTYVFYKSFRGVLKDNTLLEALIPQQVKTALSTVAHIESNKHVQLSFPTQVEKHLELEVGI